MRSQFKSTFQPAMGGQSQVRLARPVNGFLASMVPSRTFMGGAELGRSLTSAEIDSYTSKISGGRQKLVRINAWIDSKKAAQPFGWTLFDDSQVQANFYSWMDTMNSDQPSVDRVSSMLENPAGADYDIPDSDLDRTDEWALMIDYMTQAMKQYGTGVKPGQIVGPTGGTVPSGTRPGTKLPAPLPSTGISTKDALTYGGIGLGTVALILLLKNA